MLNIGMVVAATEKGLIGANGTLPWYIKADLQSFKNITLDSVLIMGRKTFNSISFPLTRRQCIVLTRDGDLLFNNKVPNVRFVNGRKSAIACAVKSKIPIYVVGGAQIYQLFQDDITMLYWTKIHGDMDGDAFFNVGRMSREMTLTESSEVFSQRNDQPSYQYLEFISNEYYQSTIYNKQEERTSNSDSPQHSKEVMEELEISKRILEEHRDVFEALAKL